MLSNLWNIEGLGRNVHMTVCTFWTSADGFLFVMKMFFFSAPFVTIFFPCESVKIANKANNKINRDLKKQKNKKWSIIVHNEFPTKTKS